MSSQGVGNDDAEPVVGRLLEAAGVQHVFAVDDEFVADMDEVIAACLSLPDDALLELPHIDDGLFEEDRPPDPILRDRLQAVWHELSPTERSTLSSEARGRAGMLDTGGQPEAGDLEPLLGGVVDFRALSLHEWLEESQGLLESVRGEGVLVVLDRDFSNEGEPPDRGIQLAADLVRAGHKQLWCCVLTHHVASGDERQVREELMSLGVEDPERVVVASKQELEDEDGFAGALKVILLGPLFSRLRQAVHSAIRQAVDVADEDLLKLDAYEFERLVFTSSLQEGLWEPDTLLRLYEIFHRDDVRRRVRTMPEVTASVRAVRRLRPIVELEQAAAVKRARQIQRKEIVELGEHINPLSFPVDAGDVFRKAQGTSEFVLVEQPCDLMVRASGRRAPELPTVTLLRVRDERPERRGSFEVPCYYEDGRSGFVDFGTSTEVASAALDYCVFDPDGESRLSVYTAPGENLPEAWIVRLERLKAELAAVLEKASGIDDDHVRKHYVAGRLAYPSDGEFRASIGNGALTFNMKRVHRIHWPRARALLVAFHNYRARDAFEAELV